MSRRRPRPDVAAASALGFYAKIDPASTALCCSRCRVKSATVRDIDGLCITCWMTARAEARGEKVSGR